MEPLSAERERESRDERDKRDRDEKKRERKRESRDERRDEKEGDDLLWGGTRVETLLIYNTACAHMYLCVCV